MDNIDKINESLNKLFSRKGMCRMISAEVVSVEGGTCTVEFLGMKVSDVKLSSAGDAGSGILLKPKVGSTVSVIDTASDLRDMYVVQCSEADAVRISGGGEDLADLISQLIDGLAQAVITTPAGAGSFAPDVVTKLNQLKVKFNTMLYGS